MYVSPPWGTFSCDYSLLLLIPCRYIYILFSYPSYYMGLSHHFSVSAVPPGASSAPSSDKATTSPVLASSAGRGEVGQRNGLDTCGKCWFNGISCWFNGISCWFNGISCWFHGISCWMIMTNPKWPCVCGITSFPYISQEFHKLKWEVIWDILEI